VTPAVPGTHTPGRGAHSAGHARVGECGGARPRASPIRFRTRPAVNRFKREMTSGAEIGNSQGVNVLASRGYAGACDTEPRFGAASEVLSFLQGAEAP
jgi:hypothetical protein